MSDESKKQAQDEEQAQIIEDQSTEEQQPTMPAEQAVAEQAVAEQAVAEQAEQAEQAEEKAEEQAAYRAQESTEEQEPLKDKAEKFWDSTRKTLFLATFKAGQYRRIVQKKIDLASLHKKISAAHGDLGRLIDEAHETGESGILERGDVQSLLERLDEYKQNAAVLEHEIEMIKAEEPEDKNPQE
ncbi:hypothetical protein SAMN05660860_01495 [Geoalkalibacter ferrihydriticus]|uniref:Uncharacterized protein n=2 Tax=Geoalkalibacter ferrihydriticus TaxID=392333 RepID=A0A0C2DSJ1_9BACT|nr:hypothetical protein [Geoalkalibacter ferrihydriticus]KIH76429.1 hypothetical protein GFER_09405 [Geoalkalibacter ferrihydriticus DSM 17813]SDL94339.1 hypothetical protein SAMN05660860_01495 [Geoalkalibacter ferrihydriticus]